METGIPMTAKVIVTVVCVVAVGLISAWGKIIEWLRRK